MKDIADMTEHIVKKAKEYDKDTIPGDYVTLTTPCPTCGGQVKENYRRYTCQGTDGQSQGCGFSFGKTPAGRAFEQSEVEAFLANKRIGPLDGFRSKAGWPFSAEMALKFNDEEQNWKLEFDFGEDKNALESGELVDFGEQVSLGACPACGARVFERGQNYVCEHTVPNLLQATPSCTFKSGKIVLQQPVEHEQIKKLLETGKTDLLDKFVSMRTRRAFKAYLAWDATAGKVQFEFEPRTSKYPARKTPLKTAGPVKAGKASAKPTAKAAKAAKAATTEKAAKATKPKAPRKPSAGLLPSATLAHVIGGEAAPRTEVIKKLWDYIKSKGLQDPKDKRKIMCDAALQAVFGKAEVNMFELAGLIGAHLSAP